MNANIGQMVGSRVKLSDMKVVGIGELQQYTCWIVQEDLSRLLPESDGSVANNLNFVIIDERSVHNLEVDDYNYYRDDHPNDS